MPQRLRQFVILIVALAFTAGCGGDGGLGTKSTVTEVAVTAMDGDPSYSATIGELTVAYYGEAGQAPALVAALTARLDGGGLAKKEGTLVIHSFTTQQRRQGPPDRGSKFGSLEAVYTRNNVSKSIKVEAKTDSTEIGNEAETWAMIDTALMAEFADAIVSGL